MEPNIAHRELRNRSGEILRAVEAGETYTVTNHGKAVARLVPMSEATVDLPLYRRATTKGGFSQLHRHSIDTPSLKTLSDLRSER